jgi:hypothetical protein
VLEREEVDMMSTKSNSLLKGVVLAGVVGLAALSPVSAGGPETFTFEQYYPLGPMASCQPFGFDFEIWSGGTIYCSVKVFKDKDGNAVRAEYHCKTDDVFANANTQVQLVGRANFRESFDFGTGDDKYRGLLWHVVVPGVGNVLHDSGLQIVNWEPFEIKVMKGTYQWNVGDFSELCAALD